MEKLKIDYDCFNEKYSKYKSYNSKYTKLLKQVSFPYYFGDEFEELPFNLSISNGSSEILSVPLETGQIILIDSKKLNNHSNVQENLKHHSVLNAHNNAVYSSVFFNNSNSLLTNSAECFSKIFNTSSFQLLST